jgi:hypothetical protein
MVIRERVVLLNPGRHLGQTRVKSWTVNTYESVQRDNSFLEEADEAAIQTKQIVG